MIYQTINVYGKCLSMFYMYIYSLYLKHHIDVHWESEAQEFGLPCMGPPL